MTDFFDYEPKKIKFTVNYDDSIDYFNDFKPSKFNFRYDDVDLLENVFDLDTNLKQYHQRESDDSFYDYFNLDPSLDRKIKLTNDPILGKDKWTDKELQIYNLQTEGGTTNRLNRAFREAEGEGKIEDIKLNDDTEYNQGLEEVRKLYTEKEEHLERIKKNENYSEEKKEAEIKNIKGQEGELLSEMKEQRKQKIVPKKRKAAIEKAFEPIGAGESKDDSEVEMTFKPKKAEPKPMTEEQKQAVRNKWSKGDDETKEKEFINNEYKFIMSKLGELSPTTNIKTTHPELFKRYQHLIKLKGGTTGNLKKLTSMINQLKTKYKSIEEIATAVEKEKERLKKDTKEESKRRNPPKTVSKPVQISDIKAEETKETEKEVVSESKPKTRGSKK
jgi:hypothetical protein